MTRMVQYVTDGPVRPTTGEHSGLPLPGRVAQGERSVAASEQDAPGVPEIPPDRSPAPVTQIPGEAIQPISFPLNFW